MLLLCHQLTPRCSTVTVSLFTTFLSRQGKSCVFCVVPSLNLTEVSKRQPCEQGTEENKRCNDLRRETKIVRKIDSYTLVRGKGKKKLYVFVTFFPAVERLSCGSVISEYVFEYGGSGTVLCLTLFLLPICPRRQKVFT